MARRARRGWPPTGAAKGASGAHEKGRGREVSVAAGEVAEGAAVECSNGSCGPRGARADGCGGRQR